MQYHLTEWMRDWDLVAHNTRSRYDYHDKWSREASRQGEAESDWAFPVKEEDGSNEGQERARAEANVTETGAEQGRPTDPEIGYGHAAGPPEGNCGSGESGEAEENTPLDLDIGYGQATRPPEVQAGREEHEEKGPGEGRAEKKIRLRRQVDFIFATGERPAHA